MREHVVQHISRECSLNGVARLPSFSHDVIPLTVSSSHECLLLLKGRWRKTSENLSPNGSDKWCSIPITLRFNGAVAKRLCISLQS